MKDWCDKEGAERLGAKIRDYWAPMGGLVRISYVDGPFTPQMRSARVDVRSDMVNGKPRDTKARGISDSPSTNTPTSQVHAIRLRMRRDD